MKRPASVVVLTWKTKRIGMLNYGTVEKEEKKGT